MGEPADRPAVHAGGCLCGAVRFEFEGEPVRAGYCHCAMCRRLSGAPVSVAAIFPRAAYRPVRGTSKVYMSSPGVARHFCPDCGSQLFWVQESRGTWDVWIGALDEPERVRPLGHIFTAEALPWFHVADDLPRFPGWP